MPIELDISLMFLLLVLAIALSQDVKLKLLENLGDEYIVEVSRYGLIRKITHGKFGPVLRFRVRGRRNWYHCESGEVIDPTSNLDNLLNNFRRIIEWRKSDVDNADVDA